MGEQPCGFRRGQRAQQMVLSRVMNSRRRQPEPPWRCPQALSHVPHAARHTLHFPYVRHRTEWTSGPRHRIRALKERCVELGNCFGAAACDPAGAPRSSRFGPAGLPGPTTFASCAPAHRSEPGDVRTVEDEYLRDDAFMACPPGSQDGFPGMRNAYSVVIRACG